MPMPRTLVIAALATAVAAPAFATVEDARSRGLKWLVQTQKGDGSFAGQEGLEVQATAAAVEALQAGGLGSAPQFSRAVGWLVNAKGGSLDARAWQVQALSTAGRDASVLAGRIRDERKAHLALNGSVTGGYIAVWGPFPGYRESIADTAMGYGALRSAGVGYTNDTTDLTVTSLCGILPAQLTTSPWSGAWPHALPSTGQPASLGTGSVVATASMLYELKRQRQAGRFLSGSACGKSSPSAIDAAMASAKTWLIAQANADGGIAQRRADTGALEASNPVLTALTVRALAPYADEGDSAALAAVAAARAWLASVQQADGSWDGDPFVTARALAALPTAAGPQLTDTDADGLTDVVEAELGTQVAVADAQGALATSAAAIAGVTASAFAADGVLGEAFSYTLATNSGNDPHIFALTDGTLPPGLSLSSAGQITGTPSATGHYAFDYRVTDAQGATALVIGRIDVAAPQIPSPGDDGDVPLPAWALAMLGGALLTAIRRRAA